MLSTPHCRLDALILPVVCQAVSGPQPGTRSHNRTGLRAHRVNRSGQQRSELIGAYSVTLLRCKKRVMCSTRKCQWPKPVEMDGDAEWSLRSFDSRAHESVD
jgi:hypothetical protein